ncbi:hypothetical protein VTN96DRAFT_3645 [Rasamsonia emersonii]|uniref:F-box domain-containing protein n=1 Tax=Rasamsonia emersonii (strain ATCC 16479 / CBS 393.64 / IMI 116815) TaxID=1408163 RepID=A0A0F4YZX0_RASE3|nr:hypothetical protein T310_2318 [Rasamsonia emersonii CBS 393.64]KKA23640.1 hypothetical protein T310_2318 [Rasamsonia emersonii CBS 393.64]
MVLSKPQLDSLPNELLYQILSYLSEDPPSIRQVHEPPSLKITRSHRRNLKHLSCTSSRFLKLVRPLLFAHACFDIEDTEPFLSFVKRSGLSRNVDSIVVLVRTAYLASKEQLFWWRRVLSDLDPLRITIVAAPTVVGEMAATKIMDAHSWAFDIPFQILQLEQDPRTTSSSSRSSRFTFPDLSACPSFLHARRWDSLVFNESSSLKAYNHYEYFLYHIPSLLDTWGTPSTVPPPIESFDPLASLRYLTSFHYTAVFPFYNHIGVVLDVVERMMINLQSLTVQLAPGPNNRVIEDEQRGSMDPNDPWMELSTGYSLIAHTVRDLGAQRTLTTFRSCDYDIEALRSNLAVVVDDVLSDSEWLHDGHGTWTRIERPFQRAGDASVAQS